jgi:tRNA threonylcarbamoyladenosine biosynthesis protein TsaE
MEFESHSPAETQDLAAKLAAKIISAKPDDGAAVIALEGDLGAGKTTFVQGFTRALGIKEAVKSPTFLLMKQYDIGSDRQLYHIDCYRLEDHTSLLPLEIQEILKNPSNIVLIEWAERIEQILPQDRITIRLKHINETTRSITIAP